MSAGSGLWSKMIAALPHLLTHGLAGEVKDVRQDIAATLKPLAGITVEEFTAPAAASATALRLSVATAVTPVVSTGALFTGASGPGPIALPYARNVTLTATSSGGSYAGSATIKGTDVNGVAITDTVAITSATTTSSVKAFKTITEVDLPAQVNTAGAISIGFGSLLGLSQVPKARSGATTAQPPMMENVDHATPTAGVIDPTNKTYAPNAVPNAAHNYTVFYELDGTSIPDA